MTLKPPNAEPDFRTDPVREGMLHEATRVYARAKGQDDRWGTYDMAELDRDSFIRFVRAHGDVSTWALHLLLIMLGHPREDVE